MNRSKKDEAMAAACTKKQLAPIATMPIVEMLIARVRLGTEPER